MSLCLSAPNLLKAGKRSVSYIHPHNFHLIYVISLLLRQSVIGLNCLAVVLLRIQLNFPLIRSKCPHLEPNENLILQLTASSVKLFFKLEELSPEQFICPP